MISGKGGKNRRRGKNENEADKRELIFKEDGQGSYCSRAEPSEPSCRCFAISVVSAVCAGCCALVLCAVLHVPGCCVDGPFSGWWRAACLLTRGGMYTVLQSTHK